MVEEGRWVCLYWFLAPQVSGLDYWLANLQVDLTVVTQHHQGCFIWVWAAVLFPINIEANFFHVKQTKIPFETCSLNTKHRAHYLGNIKGHIQSFGMARDLLLFKSHRIFHTSRKQCQTEFWMVLCAWVCLNPRMHTGLHTGGYAPCMGHCKLFTMNYLLFTNKQTNKTRGLQMKMEGFPDIFNVVCECEEIRFLVHLDILLHPKWEVLLNLVSSQADTELKIFCTNDIRWRLPR